MTNYTRLYDKLHEVYVRKYDKLHVIAPLVYDKLHEVLKESCSVLHLVSWTPIIIQNGYNRHGKMAFRGAATESDEATTLAASENQEARGIITHEAAIE